MDKTEKLLRLIEDPASFSAEERDSLLADEETRELYTLMCALSAKANGAVEITDAETEREWRRLEASRRTDRRRRFGMSRLKWAAAATAILFSAAAIATIGIKVSTKSDPLPDSSAVADSVPLLSRASLTSAFPAESGVRTEGEAGSDFIVFDNRPLREITDAIAARHGLRVEYRSDKADRLRLRFEWDRNQSLDETIESLNSFDQISITLDGKTLKID